MVIGRVESYKGIITAVLSKSLPYLIQLSYAYDRSLETYTDSLLFLIEGGCTHLPSKQMTLPGTPDCETPQSIA